MWIDATDSVEEGVWKDHDGNLLDFTYWAENEPSNSNGNQHCAVMRQSGEWDDVNCDTTDLKCYGCQYGKSFLRFCSL